MSKPEYLTETETGVEITLNKPLDIDGAKVAVLSMREPTVNDQLVAEKIKGSDAEKEIAILSNLLTITPDDVRRLTLRDYKRVQEAYLGFAG